MNIRSKLAVPARTLAAAALVALAGVTQGQGTIPAYVVDDAAITTAVKARFVDDKDIAASASNINVETLNGTVLLSGFAKSANEKATAEKLASKVNGVKLVRNAIVVQQ